MHFCMIDNCCCSWLDVFTCTSLAFVDGPERPTGSTNSCSKTSGLEDDAVDRAVKEVPDVIFELSRVVSCGSTAHVAFLCFGWEKKIPSCRKACLQCPLCTLCSFYAMAAMHIHKDD